MAATILNSPRAAQMSVYVVRAFVKLRQALASTTALSRRLETLELSVAALDADTRKQFDQVMTAPEILKRATFDSARYIGEDQSAGSIEKGKRADFFLVPGDPTKDLKAIKTIAMVVKDGVFYYPSEAYPKFGIEPFVAAPKVTLPAE
jgi:hypothetical protein